VCFFVCWRLWRVFCLLEMLEVMRCVLYVLEVLSHLLEAPEGVRCMLLLYILPGKISAELGWILPQFVAVFHLHKIPIYSLL